jgi:hypothetical protein
MKSCVILLFSSSATGTSFFIASSFPLRIASGISAAFPKSCANMSVAVADNNQSSEAHVTAAFNNLRDTLDGNYFFFQLKLAGINDYALMRSSPPF